MKVSHLAVAAVAPAMMLCSCYTVLKAPYSTSSSSSYDESRYARDSRDDLAPSVGRFDDRGVGYRDPYGLYGPGAYGQSGYPIFGYDSRYGGYGGYGYGGSPYSAGYGPYGYGYDPYYQDAGTYVPPGYELVTTQELDRLRASDSANTNPPPALDPVIIHQQQVRDAENAWSSRVNSLERRKKPPTTTRRASSTSSSSAKTTTSSDDKKPSGKAKAKSRQQRR